MKIYDLMGSIILGALVVSILSAVGIVLKAVLT